MLAKLWTLFHCGVISNVYAATTESGDSEFLCLYNTSISREYVLAMAFREGGLGTLRALNVCLVTLSSYWCLRQALTCAWHLSAFPGEEKGRQLSPRSGAKVLVFNFSLYQFYLYRLVFLIPEHFYQEPPYKCLIFYFLSWVSFSSRTIPLFPLHLPIQLDSSHRYCLFFLSCCFSGTIFT